MKFDFDSKSFDLIFATANHLYKDSNCWITGIWRERNRHFVNFVNLIFVLIVTLTIKPGRQSYFQPIILVIYSFGL